MLRRATLYGQLLKLTKLDDQYVYWEGSYMGEIKSVAGTMCSLLALRFISTDDATFSVSLNKSQGLKGVFHPFDDWRQYSYL
jgi:hypothetical protein